MNIGLGGIGMGGLGSGKRRSVSAIDMALAVCEDAMWKEEMQRLEEEEIEADEENLIGGRNDNPIGGDGDRHGEDRVWKSMNRREEEDFFEQMLCESAESPESPVKVVVSQGSGIALNSDRGGDGMDGMDCMIENGLMREPPVCESIQEEDEEEDAAPSDSFEESRVPGRTNVNATGNTGNSAEGESSREISMESGKTLLTDKTLLTVTDSIDDTKEKKARKESVVSV